MFGFDQCVAPFGSVCLSLVKGSKGIHVLCEAADSLLLSLAAIMKFVISRTHLSDLRGAVLEIEKAKREVGEVGEEIEGEIVVK